jgi:hypothetical protein
VPVRTPVGDGRSCHTARHGRDDASRRRSAVPAPVGAARDRRGGGAGGRMGSASRCVPGGVASHIRQAPAAAFDLGAARPPVRGRHHRRSADARAGRPTRRGLPGRRRPGSRGGRPLRHGPGPARPRGRAGRPRRFPGRPLPPGQPLHRARRPGFRRPLRQGLLHLGRRPEGGDGPVDGRGVGDAVLRGGRAARLGRGDAVELVRRRAGVADRAGSGGPRRSRPGPSGRRRPGGARGGAVRSLRHGRPRIPAGADPAVVGAGRRGGARTARRARPRLRAARTGALRPGVPPARADPRGGAPGTVARRRHRTAGARGLRPLRERRTRARPRHVPRRGGRHNVHLT